MPSVRHSIVSIDEVASDPATNVEFTQTSAGPSHLPRARPGVMRGTDIRPFWYEYFNPAGVVPAGGFYTVTGGAIIRDGVTLHSGSLLFGDRLMLPPSAFPNPWHSPAFHDRSGETIMVDLPDDRLHFSGTSVNLVSLGWQVYGHWLVDILPRLDRIRRSGCKMDRYVFGGPAADWQRALLTACDVPLERCEFVDVNQVVAECERLIVPSFDRLHSELHPDILLLYNRLRERVGCTQPPTRDLFIARSAWGGSKALVNRDVIEARAQQSGFEVVRPEKLTLAEQILLFSSARSIVGEMGSGMHLALFSPPGTKVGILQSSHNLNFIQAQIAQVCGHQLFYALGRNQPNELDPDSFWVDELDARHIMELVRA